MWQVLHVIDEEAVPLLRRCSLSGNADLLTHNALFTRHPLAVDMLIDILTDRGFFVAHVAEEQVLGPCKVVCEGVSACSMRLGCRRICAGSASGAVTHGKLSGFSSM